jgi:hypothetical protein
MLVTKSFIGQRLDMEHYKGVLMDRTIEIYDEDGEVFELGGDDVIFEIFAKPHGKSLESFNLGDPTDNLVVFDGQVLDYRIGLYYHECYQLVGSPIEKNLIFYGVSEML